MRDARGVGSTAHKKKIPDNIDNNAMNEFKEEEEPPPPDWAELPDRVLINIFGCTAHLNCLKAIAEGVSEAKASLDAAALLLALMTSTKALYAWWKDRPEDRPIWAEQPPIPAPWSSSSMESSEAQVVGPAMGSTPDSPFFSESQETYLSNSTVAISEFMAVGLTPPSGPSGWTPDSYETWSSLPITPRTPVQPEEVEVVRRVLFS